MKKTIMKRYFVTSIGYLTPYNFLVQAGNDVQAMKEAYEKCYGLSSIEEAIEDGELEWSHIPTSVNSWAGKLARIWSDDEEVAITGVYALDPFEIIFEV